MTYEKRRKTKVYLLTQFNCFFEGMYFKRLTSTVILGRLQAKLCSFSSISLGVMQMTFRPFQYFIMPKL